MSKKYPTEWYVAYEEGCRLFLEVHPEIQEHTRELHDFASNYADSNWRKF